MKKLLLACAAALTLCSLSDTTVAAPSPGARAFEENCSECHPGGRNIVTPAKDLRVLTLKANGINTPKDIVAKMRRPGPGMTRFSPDDLPDQVALEIAQYIFATFK